MLCVVSTPIVSPSTEYWGVPPANVVRWVKKCQGFKMWHLVFLIKYLLKLIPCYSFHSIIVYCYLCSWQIDFRFYHLFILRQIKCSETKIILCSLSLFAIGQARYAASGETNLITLLMVDSGADLYCQAQPSPNSNIVGLS